MNPTPFVHPITQYRKTLRWSQAELSRRSGVHTSTISHIERGRMIPYPSQLERIARALGVFAVDLQQGAA